MNELLRYEQNILSPHDIVHLENLHQETVQKSKIVFAELFDMLLAPNGMMCDNHTNLTIALLSESRRQDSRPNKILPKTLMTDKFEIIVE